MTQDQQLLIFRTQKQLRQLYRYEGGTLRLKAYEIIDAMQELIQSLDVPALDT